MDAYKDNQINRKFGTSPSGIEVSRLHILLVLTIIIMFYDSTHGDISMHYLYMHVCKIQFQHLAKTPSILLLLDR